MERMAEERCIEMERELKGMDDLKEDLRIRQEENREVSAERDEMERGLEKKREEKYKLLDKLDYEREQHEKKLKQKRRETRELHDLLELQRTEFEEEAKKKEDEARSLRDLLDFERSEVSETKKELNVEKKKRSVKPEVVLDDGENVREEISRAREEARLTLREKELEAICQCGEVIVIIN